MEELCVNRVGCVHIELLSVDYSVVDVNHRVAHEMIANCRWLEWFWWSGSHNLNGELNFRVDTENAFLE